MERDLALRRLQADVLLDLQRIRITIEARIEALLAAHELAVTPAQANVLLALFQAREPLTARQLAQTLSVSDVTVGRFVRALEGDGWVSRERDPSDSRAILVRPTPRAREALPRFIAVSNAIADEAFGRFSRDGIAAFADQVASVRDALSCAPDDPVSGA